MPRDNINNQFLDDLVEEAQAIREEFIRLEDIKIQEALERGKKRFNDGKQSTLAVGQVRSNLPGAKPEIVVTTNMGRIPEELRQKLQDKGYTVITNKGFKERGYSGWHAEGRFIEWSFMNSKRPEAIGVHQNMCAVCSNYVKTYGVKTNNGTFTVEEYSNFPRKIPDDSY